MKRTIIISAVFAIANAVSYAKTEGVAVRDSYHVLLKKGTTIDFFMTKFDTLARLQGALNYNLSITHKYNAFGAFSANANAAALSVLLTADEVELIEDDEVGTQHGCKEERNWGLSRISQRDLNLTAIYPDQGKAGEGVTVYIVDSGINPFHEYFERRVLKGISFVGMGENTYDMHGHGTHVAGIVGSTKFGVATKVHLVPVKVKDVNDYFPYSSVMAGLEWIYVQATKGPGRSVVNISLGGRYSQIMDQAVKMLYDANIPVIVSAGNDGRNMCNLKSPSGAPFAYTVGATNNDDFIDSNSNFGSCVNIFAPGIRIASTDAADRNTPKTGNNIPTNAVTCMSGTSQAAPHVAGVAALYLSANSNLSAKEVYDKLSSTATKDIIKGNLGGAPNRLLYYDGR